MSGPVILFKAQDPAVLQAWFDGNDPLFQKWRADVDAVKAELGGRNVLRRTYGMFGKGWVVSGYVEDDRKADPLPGFRRDAKSGHMVPALRTKAGKDWESRLAKIKYEPAPRPGLPEGVWGGNHVGSFKIENFAGAWFAWLGFNPYEGGDKPKEMGEIDPNLWEEAKFSEYYAAKEASEPKKED